MQVDDKGVPLKKILIVDDDYDFRKIMDGILTDEGFFTIEASDGAAAIGNFLLHEPDIVTLDFQMPQLDGFEALKHLKLLRPKVPVVVVTACSTLVWLVGLSLTVQLG
jgi:CheY-like chemotaxis protein